MILNAIDWGQLGHRPKKAREDITMKQKKSKETYNRKKGVSIECDLEHKGGGGNVRVGRHQTFHNRCLHIKKSAYSEIFFDT